MNNIEYYTITIQPSATIPSVMFHQIHKNELFLSANGRVCGLTKMAYLESKELAEQFMDAYMPRLKKRYGRDVTVNVVCCSERGQIKKTLAQIKSDSDLARKRLETGMLASNQLP